MLNPKNAVTIRPAIETLETRSYPSGAPAAIAVTVPGPIPPAVIAGSIVNDKIAISVANNDQVNKATGRVSITLFASTINTLDSSASQIQEPRLAPIHIAPGHNHVYTIRVKAFPQNLSGSYYILAEVAGAGVNTTTGASIAQSVISPPFVDLAGTVLKAPTNARVGRTIPVTLQVNDNGNSPAKGSLSVLFELSGSSDGSNPVQLATIAKPINLKAGKNHVLHFRVPLAVGLQTGNQYIVAVVDPTNAFGDTNLVNNTFVYQTALSIT